MKRSNVCTTALRRFFRRRLASEYRCSTVDPTVPRTALPPEHERCPHHTTPRPVHNHTHAQQRNNKPSLHRILLHISAEYSFSSCQLPTLILLLLVLVLLVLILQPPSQQRQFVVKSNPPSTISAAPCVVPSVCPL